MTREADLGFDARGVVNKEIYTRKRHSHHLSNILFKFKNPDLVQLPGPVFDLP